MLTVLVALLLMAGAAATLLLQAQVNVNNARLGHQMQAQDVSTWPPLLQPSRHTSAQ